MELSPTVVITMVAPWMFKKPNIDVLNLKRNRKIKSISYMLIRNMQSTVSGFKPLIVASNIYLQMTQRILIMGELDLVWQFQERE